MITLEKISKIYPAEPPGVALDDVSLHIERNSFVVVVGRSGSGKSTLLNIMGALSRPTSGRVSVAGIDVATANDAARSALRNSKIGFVFQSFHVLKDRTALENVRLPARFADAPVPDPDGRALECLERVGLAHGSERTCSSLSGGQLQRVAIARALFMRPGILLADEPTGNLDVNTGAEILGLFNDLRKSDDLTLVVVTHESSLAGAADRVVKIDAGKIVEDGGRC